MGFYRDDVYPRLVNGLGDPVPIRYRRRQLLCEARGTVLEIGVGSGANFPYYDPARVDKIYALEPNPGMVQLAERRLRRTALTVEFLGVPGERIPLAERVLIRLSTGSRCVRFPRWWMRFVTCTVS
jgi:Methyltransferase domain